MANKIGIDAGGSLIKVAFEEKDHFHVKTYGNDELESVVQWLQMVNPDATLYLTGGKSNRIKNITKQPVVTVEEFEAIILGSQYLLKKEYPNFNKDFILVSIGTGTSIFHVTKDYSERMLGTGVGGGTFIGLGTLLTGRNEFNYLTKLAQKGSSLESDLLVRDIYAPDEPPIAGNLTAANFGKAHLNQKARVEDHVAALTRLVGETIISLAALAASKAGVEKIVFVGSTLNGNRALREVLSGFQQLMNYEPIFLEKGSYAGAIGTLLT